MGAKEAKSSRGQLLVIAAGSGTGKSTLCREILQRDRRARLSISYTTRPAREGEVEGEHYYFVSPEVFQGMREGGELLEWAQVHGQWYGTGRGATEEALRQGALLLLDIDVQGAQAIRRHFGSEAILLFLLPPSWEVMRQRLGDRGTETPAQIERRLRTARQELPAALDFDYLVVNDQLEEAVETVLCIVRAAASRPPHLRPLLEEIIAGMEEELQDDQEEGKE